MCLGSANFSYGFDPQGNTVKALRSDGLPRNGGTFDAFGKNRGPGTPGDYVSFGAQWGGFTDSETGLVLFTHRFYDPSEGRFLTRDPISYNGGVNLYGYTGNNPVNRWDPKGYNGLGGGVIGGIIGIVIVVIVTGGVAIVPVIIGGVVGGAIGGALFGGTSDHVGDAVEGAAAGGFVACVVIFRGRPPLLPPGQTPPPGPPVPPDKIWPPPPNMPR